MNYTRRPGAVKRLVRLLSLLFFISIGIYVWPSVFSNQKPYIDNKFNVSSQGVLSAETPANSLEEAVLRSLQGTKGTYSVVIKNLKTNESYAFNEEKEYEAGSLYKLWVMAAVYDQIEKGKLQKYQVLSDTIPSLNSKFGISEEDAELTKGNISMTVSEALEQMITISHNYAALLLTDKVKMSTVSTYTVDKGFTKSLVGSNTEPPKTTASDMALFMEKLYKNELGNTENTAEMIERLKRQRLRKKIPADLPRGTQVAHKTGEISWFTHDVGIVFTDKGDFIIVAMSESDSPPGAEQRIAQLSKSVYEYFMNKN